MKITFNFGQTNLYVIRGKRFDDDKQLTFKFLDTDKYFGKIQIGQAILIRKLETLMKKQQNFEINLFEIFP